MVKALKGIFNLNLIYDSLLSNGASSLRLVLKKIQNCFTSLSGRGSCDGDNGGPLVYRTFASDPWYQVGITSFGRCGEEGVADVYTKVSEFIPWIQSNLED